MKRMTAHLTCAGAARSVVGVTHVLYDDGGLSLDEDCVTIRR